MSGMETGEWQTTRTSKECLEAAKVLVSEAERLKEKEKAAAKYKLEYAEKCKVLADKIWETQYMLAEVITLAAAAGADDVVGSASDAISCFLGAIKSERINRPETT